jgi:hypothetical protein
MKYSVEGFDQSEMVNLGMDAVDAVLLRWVVDFWPFVTKRLVGGREFGWIAFAHVVADLPILRNSNPESMARQFRGLVKKGILISYVDRVANSKTYFAFGPAYETLIHEPATERSGAGDRTVTGPATELSDNPNTNDPSTRSEEGGVVETVPTKPVSDLFSSLFSERSDGARPTFAVRYVGPIQQYIRRHGLEKVLLVVHGYFEVDWWFTKDKALGRRSWSYSGLLNHFDEILSGLGRGAVESEYMKTNGETIRRLMGSTA